MFTTFFDDFSQVIHHQAWLCIEWCVKKLGSFKNSVKLPENKPWHPVVVSHNLVIVFQVNLQNPPLVDDPWKMGFVLQSLLFLIQ